MPNDHREPTAEMRAFAANAFQMFLALTQEGFTEQQALSIIGIFIAAQVQSEQQSGE